MRVGSVARIGRQQAQLRIVLIFDLVDDTHVSVYQRRQLGQKQPAHGRKVALALQHVVKFGQVGLQPVLFGVHVGGQTQIADHGVDVVFELGDFAARIDLDRAGEIALGDGGRDLGDGAHLRGQIGGQQVDVAGQIFPGAGGARHVRLTPQPAFHAHLACHAGDLIGERRQRVRHVVDGLGEGGDFAFGLHGQVLLQVAIGDGRHHLDDAAHLFGQVGRHEVHGIGQILPGTGHAGDLGLSAELALGADFARDAGHLAREGVQLVDHGVDGIFKFENLALHVDRDLARQVSPRDRRRDFGDVADLRGEIRRQQIDVVGEILPRAADAGHHGLAAEPALGADLARHARHFGGERAQLLDHGIQGVLEKQDFAANVDRDLFGKIAAGDRGGHLGDVANLGGQVRCHEVDVVGEILPGAGDFRHLGLTAELAFGADFACHARHFGSERVQLIDHRIDGVLKLQNFALDVHGDLARQVAARDRGGDFGDVANLGGQIARHRVHAVGEILPGAGHARHVGLAAEAALGADLARHARHLAGEPVELIHHGVEGFFQLQDLAAHVDGDLARKVAAGDGGRDLGNIANLGGQIARHRIDAVGQVFPGAGDAGHLGLTAELAVGSDFTRDARHLTGEGVELIHHGVERFLQLKNFARYVHRDFLGEIALRDRGRDFGDVSDLTGQIARHRIDAVGQILPGAGDAAHQRLAAELALGSDFARDTRHLTGEGVELVDHRIDRFLELKDFARHVHGNFLGEVAARDRGGDVGDVTHLRGQVAGHEVDVVGEILPGSGDAGDLRLTAQLALGSYFARHARHFGGKGIELVYHRVDGVLQLQNFAADIHGNFSRKVAARDRRRDVGDIADLCGQVAAHRIHGVGQVFPGSGDAGNDRLAAQLAIGADFTGDAGDFGCERAQLVHHRVDGFLQLQNFTAHVDGDLLGQIAVGNRDGHFGDVANLAGKVVGHRVHAFGQILPDPRHLGNLCLTSELALGSHFARDARHLRGEHAELLDHRIDDVGRLQELAAQWAAIDIQFDGLQQVSLGNGGNGAGDFTRRPQQVVDQRVDRALHVRP